MIFISTGFIPLLLPSIVIDDGYVGKQPVAWKEYWLKELKESMDKRTGCCDTTEILLKMVLNTIQSINQSINQSISHLRNKSENTEAKVEGFLKSHVVFCLYFFQKFHAQGEVF